MNAQSPTAMKTIRMFSLCSILALSSSATQAAVIVDGSRDFDYGPALAVQTVETGFGDNANEWNAAYGRIESGRLYLMLTGNLQDNFNRLDVFIDSKAGGQLVFDSSGNDNASNMDGLQFDVGFSADYHLIFRRGTDVGNPMFNVDFANLGAQSASGYLDIMGGLDGIGATGTGVNASTISVAYDGSNVAGILGGSDPANQLAALAVTTGLEWSVALSDLGYAGGAINVMVGQNNQDHNYWSNQFLAGLAVPQGNLGGDGAGGFTGEGAIDFTTLRGYQFFTVPEPSALALLASGVTLACAWGRRRPAAAKAPAA